MRTIRLAIATLALVACVHEDETQTTVPLQGAQVTQVNQTNVIYQTTPVTVNYGSQIDCEAMCRRMAHACELGCRPSAWSPNMQSIQDSCEHDCDFNEFACVGDCQRSR